jgi:hypothetical protein
MSCRDEHARTEQIVVRPSIHLPFDRLEPVDLALDRARTPPLDNAGPHGIDISGDALGQAAEFAVSGSPGQARSAAVAYRPDTAVAMIQMRDPAT